MFVKVTPIGSSATDVSAAAMVYVDYLCQAGLAPVEETATVADYYAGQGSLPTLDGPAGGVAAAHASTRLRVESSGPASPPCSRAGTRSLRSVS